MHYMPFGPVVQPGVTAPVVLLANARLLIGGDEGAIVDESVHGHTVTAHGSPAPTVDTTYLSLGAGMIYFPSGGGSYLTVPHAASLDISASGGRIELRLRRGAGAVSELYINKGADSTSLYPWQLWYESPSGKVGFRGFDSGGALAFSLQTLAAIANNTEYHVAGVWDTAEARLYLDGVLQASAAFTGTLWQNTAPVSIGAYANGLSAATNLRLADVLISDDPLYTGASFTPPVARYAVV